MFCAFNRHFVGLGSPILAQTDRGVQAYLTVRADLWPCLFQRSRILKWTHQSYGGLDARRTIEGIMNSSNHLLCQFLRRTSRSRLVAARTTCRSSSIRAFGTDNDMKDETLYFHISPR